MKLCQKIVKVIVALAVGFMLMNTTIYAAELSKEEPLKVAGISDIINAGKGFIQEGEQNQVNGTTVDEFAEALAPIGSILAGVGIVIFIAVLAIMAIRWITAKPDQKAKLQQQFVGYVVAAIVFFGAVGIWQMVRRIMEQVSESI